MPWSRILRAAAGVPALPRPRDVSLHVGAYLRRRAWFGALALVCLAAGITVGSLSIGWLSPDEVDSLVRYLRSISGAVSVAPEALLRWTNWRNLELLLLISLLGLTVLGLPGIALLIFARGYAIGFTVAFLAVQFGFRGVLFAAAGMLPPYLILLPAVVALGAAGMALSWQVWRQRALGRPASIAPLLPAHAVLTVLTLAAVLAASLLETYVAPALLRLIGPLV